MTGLAQLLKTAVRSIASATGKGTWGKNIIERNCCNYISIRGIQTDFMSIPNKYRVPVDSLNFWHYFI